MFEIIAILVVVLDFLNPFDRRHATGFTMLPHGDATGVSWPMHGPANLMAKLTQIFMNLDDRIGQGF
jgi:hypothetical protein